MAGRLFALEVETYSVIELLMLLTKPALAVGTILILGLSVGCSGASQVGKGQIDGHSWSVDGRSRCSESNESDGRWHLEAPLSEDFTDSPKISSINLLGPMSSIVPDSGSITDNETTILRGSGETFEGITVVRTRDAWLVVGSAGDHQIDVTVQCPS